MGFNWYGGFMLAVCLIVAPTAVSPTTDTLSDRANPETAPRMDPPPSSPEHQEHRLAAATSILQNLLLQTLQHDRAKMLGSSSVPREISYHDGETIATVHTDLQGNITRCSLFEIKRLEDIDRTLATFAEENKPVQKITFRTMLNVITACQAIDPALVNLQPSVDNTNPPKEPQDLNLTYMRSVISGILPGTKWCGLGDIAQDYEDLGKEKELDKCCRAHDHCPTKLKSFRRGYGLINWSLYTKSHCECDSLLYECLKAARTPTSEMLGNFYFNVLQVQCIDEEKPVRCMTREKLTNSCRLWVPDENSPSKKLFFRDVRRQF